VADHAKLMSPSSAARRIACPGSHVLESLVPDNGNPASRDGSAMHEVAAMCLLDSASNGGVPVEPHGFVGRYFVIDGEKVEFDEDMADLVKPYVDTIRTLAAGHELLVEQRVDFSRFVGVDGCFGTADAIILRPAEGGVELQVHDFKSGYHRVEVERNPQLMLYALGAYDVHGLMHELVGVRLFIHQPKIADEPSEWACTVGELLAFAEEAKHATHACKAAEWHHKGNGIGDEFVAEYLRPEDDACRFCKAAGTCPALTKHVEQSIGADFSVLAVGTDIDVSPVNEIDLGQMMAAAPLVETWLKAVRAETERRLLAGQPVPGFKLVQGKKGPRKWQDPEAAEQQLKSMRLKVEEMYQLKLISPTAAEKLTKAPAEGEKPILGPRQWTKLQTLVTQSPGSPSVAPESDKRPALVITPVSDDFEPVATKSEGVEALL
jgi:hypothetical protein